MENTVEKSCWAVAVRATITLVAIIVLGYLTVGF